MDKHNEAVLAISIRIEELFAQKKPFRIYDGATNSTRESKYHRDNIVDTSALSHVLKVDRIAQTALVEPNVAMDMLVETTLKFGLIPPVVMEFPGITAGGGFAGTSGESSSFKYGVFDRTVNWIEIVLANGEATIASPTNNRDLFHGAAESLGTLGVTTLLELRLIPAKAFVKLTYQPIQSISDAITQIEAASKNQDVQYIDGIIFSKTIGVLCIGQLIDTPSASMPIQRFARSIDDWFYTHAASVLAAHPSSAFIEAIPITDYLFRYDRGGFWTGHFMFYYFLTPFNRFTRWLYDRFLSTRAIYTMGHAMAGPTQAIFQDVSIPYQTSPEFFDYLHQEWGHYPIWLCPIKQKPIHEKSAYSLASRDRKAMLLNFGVWGPGPGDREEFISWNRRFEHKVNELGGQKFLYAHCYYTEEEFGQIYLREEYDKLRKKHGAEGLLRVYQKVRVDCEVEKRKEHERMESWSKWLRWWVWNLWPIAGLWGLWCVWRGGDYLLRKGEGGNRVKVVEEVLSDKRKGNLER